MALVTSAPLKESADPEFVYGALHGLMGRLGHRPPPWEGFKRSPDAPTFRRHAEMLMAYVRERVRARRRPTQLRALDVLLRMLARRLKRDEVPVTLRTLVRNMGRIPAVAADAFPGYEEAGLLPTLVLKFRIHSA